MRISVLLILSVAINLLWSFGSVSNAAPQAKRAFVVGISKYDFVTKLDSPAQDAKRFGEKLVNLGYTVVWADENDTARNQLVIKWAEFIDGVNQGDDVVVYYSGHGVEIDGANYIIPKDIPSVETLKGKSALESLAMPVDHWLKDLSDRSVHVEIIILDACRDNPFVADTKRLGGVGGLDTSETPLGVFIFYSAGNHETALDHKIGEPANLGSIYTRTFLDIFDTYKDRPVRDFAAALKRPVEILASPHMQHPFYMDGLDDEWCFSTCASRQAKIDILTKDGLVGHSEDTETLATARPPSPPIGGVPVYGVPAPSGSAQTSNAIFIGKRSMLDSSDDCLKGITDLYPLGCRILQAFAKQPDASYVKNLLSNPLRVETNVNVRKRIPTVNEKQQGIYSCVVGQFRAGEEVRISAIVKISYAHDDYFWGLLEAPPKNCLR